MKRPNVLHDIIPLTEFRAKMAEFIEQMKQSQSPLVLTQHGRAVAVVMPPAAYEEMAYRDEFVQAIREAEDSLDAGKGIPHEEVMAWFKARSDEIRRKTVAKADEPLTDEQFHAALARADKKMAEKYGRATPKPKKRKARA
jgi:prevent-host-death family protein